MVIYYYNINDYMINNYYNIYKKMTNEQKVRSIKDLYTLWQIGGRALVESMLDITQTMILTWVRHATAYNESESFKRDFILDMMELLLMEHRHDTEMLSVMRDLTVIALNAPTSFLEDEDADTSEVLDPNETQDDLF